MLVRGIGVKAAATRRLSIRAEFLSAQARDATYRSKVDGRLNAAFVPWAWSRASIGIGVRF